MSEPLSLNKLPQEIRNCRHDRTALIVIAIAGKKQARDMIRADNAYKVKQQKKRGTDLKSIPRIFKA